MPVSVSAIVPVYDEEKTVSRVIEVLLASPLVNEVIAVNDGSRDRSAEILKGFGYRMGSSGGSGSTSGPGSRSPRRSGSGGGSSSAGRRSAGWGGPETWKS